MDVRHDPGNNPLPLDIREIVQYIFLPRKEGPRRISRINFQGGRPRSRRPGRYCCLAIAFHRTLCALLELAEPRFEGFLDVREFLGGSGLNHLVERGNALLALLPEISILRLAFFRRRTNQSASIGQSRRFFLLLPLNEEEIQRYGY